MNQAVAPHDPLTGEITETKGLAEAEQSLAVSLARAEVDQQVATARAMPRDIRAAKDRIFSLATLDQETSEECVYALVRSGKSIRGPSIRMAEIISNLWGNCRVGARVVHVDRFEKYIEAEGVFHDLETNTATTSRVRRRISNKQGKLFNDDMIVVTGNAACSIAKRNAILGGVPKAVWRQAFMAVESVLAGDEKPLAERRAKALKAFAALGINPDRIFQTLEINSEEEMTRDHVLDLIGAHSAIKNNELTIDEVFPPEPETDGADSKGNKGGKGKTLGEKMDDLADSKKSKKPEGGAKKKPSGKPAGDKETTAESSAGNSDDETDEKATDDAFRAGKGAARKGMQREAIPPKYQKDEDLKAAWLSGFDEENGDDETGSED